MTGLKKIDWSRYWRREFIACFFMGFSSGVPLLIGYTVVQAWLKQSNVPVETIGLLAAVGLPYSLKFLWAPWLDYYALPFLGRRRGWMFISQLGLIVGILVLSGLKADQTLAIGVVTLFICFCSATQDIVVDAYRRDDLPDEDLTLGTSYYTWGYRFGMLAVSSGGLILANEIGWAMTFKAIATLIVVGLAATVFNPEPHSERASRPAGAGQTILTPIKEFLSKPSALLILAFVFFYKFGDQLAGTLTTSFYLDMKYTLPQIGIVAKFTSLIGTLVGVVLGAWGVKRLGMYFSLGLFGFAQMISTLGFVALNYLPVSSVCLGVVIFQENLAAGAGTAAFLAFMAGQTSRTLSASQFALLTSLMALPRTILSTPSGYMVKMMGWPGFFTLSAVLALPGFILLYYLYRQGVFKTGLIKSKPGLEVQ